MTIIGIDLGTTNSALAIMKNGRPEIIENRNGGRTTPSVVQIDLDKNIVVGQVAKDGIVSLYDRTVLEVKRKMGTNDSVMLADQSYRPEEISALILKELKQSAEERLGEKVTEAIITVPAYFNDTQRRATKTAGEIAGLKIERIINEPTAAAIAFGFDNMDKDQKILVYDLGGGTFDVSIVEMFDGILDVRSSAGNNFLGGTDFDQAIEEWILNRLKKETGLNLPDVVNETKLAECKIKLKVEAEKVKKLLSFQTSARIHLPLFFVHEGNPISIDTEITRLDFEQMIKSLALSTLNEIDKVLGDAKLTISDIDEVLLVGGSTRIPYIREIVEKKFGKSVRKDINPDEAVALGAAIQAGIKSGEISSVDGLMVTDVCPYTLGTDIIKMVGGQLVVGYFDPIIQRNMTIPSSRTKTYFTASDDQESVLVKVFQGDETYSENNHFLGEIELTGIPLAPAGEQSIDVKFEYDINGVLQVEATIVSIGKKISTTISNMATMSNSDIIDSQKKLNDGWEHSELLKEVKSVIYRAEKVIQEASEDDKQAILKVLNQLKEALAHNDKSGVEKYEEELTDLLIELV